MSGVSRGRDVQAPSARQHGQGLPDPCSQDALNVELLELWAGWLYDSNLGLGKMGLRLIAERKAFG
jgi:hypothetical protein